jgi:hypothetical protein
MTARGNSSLWLTWPGEDNGYDYLSQSPALIVGEKHAFSALEFKLVELISSVPCSRSSVMGNVFLVLILELGGSGPASGCLITEDLGRGIQTFVETREFKPHWFDFISDFPSYGRNRLLQNSACRQRR